MSRSRRHVLQALAAAALSTLAIGAGAQDTYPSKPIRIDRALRRGRQHRPARARHPAADDRDFWGRP
jgi:hypothetical protein